MVKIAPGDEQVLKITSEILAAMDTSHCKGFCYEKDCAKGLQNLNHAILIVGYEVEPNW